MVQYFHGEIHGTRLFVRKWRKWIDDLRELHLEVVLQNSDWFDGRNPEMGTEGAEALAVLRVKVIEMLGSEGPQIGDILAQRLHSRKDGRAYPPWIGNTVLSVGFTNRPMTLNIYWKLMNIGLLMIQKTLSRPWVQNLVLDKTFKQYDDGFTAFDSHVLFQSSKNCCTSKRFQIQRRQDMQLDSDVIMGRLLHNRMGYTTKDTIPMLLGLKLSHGLALWESYWKDPLRRERHSTRNSSDFPKGDEHELYDLKYAMSNLERQMLVVKQFEDVVGRRRGYRYSIAFMEFTKHWTLKLHLSNLSDAWGRSKAVLWGSMSLVHLKTWPSPWWIWKNQIESPKWWLSFLTPRHSIACQKKLMCFNSPDVKTEKCEFWLSPTRMCRGLFGKFSVLDRGWYLPVFKGIDPIGKVLMFKVNDYLVIKDIHVPTAYLDEFCTAFELLLENHADQLVDVAVMSNFNSEPVTNLDDTTRSALESIGFKMAGERMIRGGLLTLNLVKSQKGHFSINTISTKNTAWTWECCCEKSGWNARRFRIERSMWVVRVDLKSIIKISNRLTS